MNKKIFVFLGSADSPTWPAITVKLQDSNAEALGVPGAENTGYGLGTSGWVTVPLATPKAPPFGVLTDWVEESYRFVAPKRLVAELDVAHRCAPALPSVLLGRDRRREAVMRIVISEFLTLDGVMQAPGGSEEDRSEGFEHGGWQLDNGYVDDVVGQVVTEAFESSDGMLLGRRTYDIFAGYWPTSTEEPIAGQMNAMKKYVASTTLKEPLEWENSTLLHGDVVEAAQKLREEAGRDLQVIGSGNFAQTLMNNGLVDEYRLMIHPIVLGSGRRLFNVGHEPFQLTLLDCKTSTTGVVILSYRPS